MVFKFDGRHIKIEYNGRDCTLRDSAISYGLGIRTSTFLEFNKSSQVPIMRK